MIVRRSAVDFGTPTEMVRVTTASLAAALFTLLGAGTLTAQVGVDDPILRSVENIQIVEHLEAQLSLDISFQDETGAFVPLSTFFDGERPVVLNLAYFSCPMLCNLVTEGLIEAVNEIGWTLGDEFRVVTISIDPRDTPAGARARKDLLVREHGRRDAIDGWHLLTGNQTNIRRVADTVGFGFEWNEFRSEYAHGAVLILLTPDGRVSRYIYGVRYDAEVVRLSLVEASEGKVGSTMDKLFLLCFHYDPSTAQYGPMAQGIMKVGGLLTMVLLVGGFIVMQRSRRRKRDPSVPPERPLSPKPEPVATSSSATVNPT